MGRSLRDAVELPAMPLGLSVSSRGPSPFRQARARAAAGDPRAALDEFAAHGFHDASLNRIIEAAGISKGSMYYYFDGKEDLFAHVTRIEFEHLFAASRARSPARRR